MFDAKKREERKKKLGIIPDGDHVYYVASKHSKIDENEDTDLTFSDDSQKFTNIKKINLHTKDEKENVPIKKIFTITPPLQTNSVIEKTTEEIGKSSKIIPNLVTKSSSSSKNGEIVENINHIDLNGKSLDNLHEFNTKNMEHLMKLNNALKGGNFSFKYQNNKEKNENLYKKDVVLINNANMVKSKSEATLVENQNCNNISDLNIDQKQQQIPKEKSLTYYDVKHPKTTKVLDRNKGIITTETDLGTVFFY